MSLFDQGAVPDQERFLFETITANQCLLKGKAASEPSSGCTFDGTLTASERVLYQQNIVDAATKYVNWYSALAGADVDSLKKLARARVKQALIHLGNALEALKHARELVEAFEEFAASSPAFFFERSLDLWEAGLAKYPDLTEGRRDSQTRTDVRKDEGLKRHWQQYEEFLRALPNRNPEMQVQVRSRLKRVKQLLGENA